MLSPSSSPGSRLLSVAAARPSVVHTAADLGAPFGKDAGWVESRTGIRSLRRLAPNESIEDLAVSAGQRAMARAGTSAAVDLVITASCDGTPDQGSRIAARLAPGAPWFGINSACSGFTYALATADTLIRTGSARVVLIVASEHMSRFLDPTDLSTSIVFADGAGAAVVEASQHDTGIGPLACGSDGTRSDMIACEHSGELRMQGQSVFRWAIEAVPEIAAEACRRAGVDPSDIDVFIPHQANLRITDALVRKLKLDHATVAADIITSGNSSAASIPMALDHVLESDPAMRGRLALLVGFGAGLSFAAQVVRLPAPTAGTHEKSTRATTDRRLR